MFTGLIRSVETVAACDPTATGRRLAVAPGAGLPPVKAGDSVAVDGCCLTVVAFDEAGRPIFDLSHETLSRTTAGEWTEGRRLNLEPSLKVGDELGGHLVFGHVDGIATVEARTDGAETSDFWLACPAGLGAYVAEKGSLALDGISLTVNAVRDGADGLTRLRLTLVPYTLAVTTWGQKQPGDRCNLEVDMLARYVARQTAALSAAAGQGPRQAETGQGSSP